MNNFYVTLISKEDQTNWSSRLLTRLAHKTQLEGDWSVALCELNLNLKEKVGAKSSNVLFVYNNISENQYVNDMAKPILRTVLLNNTTGAKKMGGHVINSQYVTPYYVKLCCKSLDYIELEFRNYHNETLQFNSAYAVLHFKRQ